MHHAALHTAYPTLNGMPVRRTQIDSIPPFVEVDASSWTESSLRQAIAAHAAEPFDLSAGPLVRWVLFRRGPADFVLLLVGHHIVIDGWSSVSVLLPELRARYTAALDGRSPELPGEGTATYADYARWQSAWIDGPGAAAQRAYWHTVLDGQLPTLNLLTDRPRVPKRFVGATLRFCLEPFRDALCELARQQHTTLYTVLMSAFQMLLNRFSNQEDLLIGVPMSGRTDRRFRHTIGYFVNTVPLRASLQGDPTFRTVLGQTHRALRDAARHQDYPLGLLVDELQPARDVSRSPLFDVMFNYVHAPRLTARSERDRAAAVLPMTLYPLPQQEGQFDVVLDVANSDEGLEAELRYCTDLFDERTAAAMVTLYQELLEAVLVDPDAPMSALPGPAHG